MKTELEEIDAKVKGIQGQKSWGEDEKKLREIRDRLDREVDVKNYDALIYEREQIQEKLWFWTLTANEEKKLMDRKSKLDIQEPKVKLLKETKEKLFKMYEVNKEPNKQLKELNEKKNDIIKRKKEVHKKIDDLKATVLENKQAVE